jgi:hypothetical protein
LIPPKQEVEVAAPIRPNCRITFAEMQSVADGPMHFYFLGEARYRDGIDKITEHVTQYAKELVLDLTTDGRQSPIASAISRGRHNCADKDCPE